MKLVSDLKQFLILNDFPSVNEAIDQRNQQLRALQEECDRKLITLRDEIDQSRTTLGLPVAVGTTAPGLCLDNLGLQVSLLPMGALGVGTQSLWAHDCIPII